MATLRAIIFITLILLLSTNIYPMEGEQTCSKYTATNYKDSSCTHITPLLTQWKVKSILKSSESSKAEIDIVYTDLRLLFQYPHYEKFSIEFTPQNIPINIGLGYFSVSGVSQLFQHPVLNNINSLSALPLKISRSNNSSPSLVLSTPYIDAYASYFTNTSLGLLGIDIKIPFHVTTLAKYRFINIPPEHNLLRFALQYETWRGNGSRSLIDSHWFPGIYNILNAASIINIPFQFNNNNSQETFEAIFGVQSQLPRRIISQKYYITHPSVFWMRIHFESAGQIGASEYLPVGWKIRAQFLHLSSSYIRRSSQSLINPDTSFTFTGDLMFKGIVDIQTILYIHAQKNTRFQIGIESDTSYIAFGAILNFLPDTNRLNTQLFFKTLGNIALNLSVHINRKDLASRFENFAFSFDLDLAEFQMGADLTIENKEDFQNSVDFFPSPFETTIGVSFDLTIKGRISNTLSSLQLKASSPKNFFLSNLLYEENLGGFFENWSIEFIVELSN